MSRGVKSIEGFKKYLEQYVEEDSPLGDFASDVMLDKNFPENFASKKELVAYLVSNGACDAAINVGKAVFDTSRLEKQPRSRRLGLGL